jgi:hypothetical protein
MDYAYGRLINQMETSPRKHFVLYSKDESINDTSETTRRISLKLHTH